MKKLLLALAGLSLSLVVAAQKSEPTPAAAGVTYGAGASKEGAIGVNELEKSIVNNKFEGKINGKVSDVCKDKGCWMKIERADGSKVMVKFKDYGFFMPKDIVGKQVVLDGEASVKEVSVKQLKHYAEDAGKSKEEIAQIKEPQKEIIFVAKGVLVL